MTNFNPSQQTFLQTVINNSYIQEFNNIQREILDEIQEGNVGENSDSKSSIDSAYTKNGSKFVFNIPATSVLFESSKDIWKNMQNSFYKSGDSGETTIPNLSKVFPDDNCFSITTIDGTYDFNTCIHLIKSVYDGNKDSFYGALLRRTSNRGIINPLHPIIAQSQVFSKKELSGNFTVIIYMVNKDMMNENDRLTKAILYSKEYDSLFYNSIIANIGSITEKETAFLKPKHLLPSGNFTKVKYLCDYVDAQGNEIPESTKMKYLIPVQLVNKGIVYPYYGLVLLEQDRRCKGIQLSPMQSCNVGMQQFNAETNVPYFGSVCTGILPNDSKKGRESLNHANLGSPYFREILMEGAFRYAQIANQVSLSLYSNMFDIGSVEFDFDIDAPPVVIPKRCSFEEYREAFPSATLIDYMAFIKRINEMEFKANE